MNNEIFTIATPQINNLTGDEFNSIYSPSEDSFLLIDALEKDFKKIIQLNPSICLEIGVGSGIIITALATVLGDSCTYFGTDINYLACKKAKETAELNNVILKTFCCDLASEIPIEIKGKIDIILFNPPYVVTPGLEIGAGDLEYTWAGGMNGREVMDRLFPEISLLLSPKGVFYLVAEKENNLDEIKSILHKYGYSNEEIISRKVHDEHLTVLKFYK